MRKGRCDWTVDRRLQEMRAALTGIILDDLRLRRKLINLGVDVAPAPRRSRNSPVASRSRRKPTSMTTTTTSPPELCAAQPSTVLREGVMVRPGEVAVPAGPHNGKRADSLR